MITFTLICMIFAVVLATMLAYDWAVRRSRRRDRDMARRVIRYLDQLPPAKPW